MRVDRHRDVPDRRGHLDREARLGDELPDRFAGGLDSEEQPGGVVPDDLQPSLGGVGGVGAPERGVREARLARRSGPGPSASASVRPTLASSGSVKTTEGIVWNWKRVGRPAIASAATTPSR